MKIDLFDVESPLSRLFHWCLIEDGRLVRLIYVDEAGTSPAEPVRVVASVIVHGDDELRLLTSEIERITSERVPEAIREGFVFHAKEVFNGGKRVDRNQWPFEDRLDYLKEVLCLPFVHDVPIAVGICFKGKFDSHLDEAFWKRLASQGVGRSTFEHGVAFSNCAEKSDLFLRKYRGGKEIGVIVAEDVPSNKKFLAKMGMWRKGRPLTLSQEHVHQTVAQKLLGIEPKPYVSEITHIVDVPNFVDKGGAPLLQLADACAFTFRRYLSRQRYGEDLIFAMLGPGEGQYFIDEPAWFTGTSSGLFNTHKYFSDEQRREAHEMDQELRRMRALASVLPR